MLPGWYPDPWGGPGQRYWDGRQWTAATVAGSPKHRVWLLVLVAVIAVPVLFFGGCAAVIAFGSRNAPDLSDEDYVGSRSIVSDQRAELGVYSPKCLALTAGAALAVAKVAGAIVVVTVSPWVIGPGRIGAATAGNTGEAP
ncbi:DUF2510 domain-containing protein [Mycolicibacterium sphagni]|uniref:DUF2510 domain-containing protein n=1 Tax=Mycolicibacterium sphagni TaxID=1786 RepID=UPI001966A013|nr:DUF2510 domain-containing protein [Mycolicibacterium sphagni]